MRLLLAWCGLSCSGRSGSASVLLIALGTLLGKVWIERIAGRETQTREAALATLRADFEKQGGAFQAQLVVSTQRTVLVDKVQFEHEYEIYRTAWASLVPLREAALGLRPTLDHVDPGEAEADRQMRRLQGFAACFNAFYELVEANKPSIRRWCTRLWHQLGRSAGRSPSLTSSKKAGRSQSTGWRQGRTKRRLPLSLMRPARPFVYGSRRSESNERTGSFFCSRAAPYRRSQSPFFARVRGGVSSWL